MRRLDRRGAITFIDVAEDAGACPASRADMLARFHAREGGRVSVKARDGRLVEGRVVRHAFFDPGNARQEM